MADTSATESLRTWEAMLLLLLLGSLALGRLVAPGFLGASNVGNLLSRLIEVALIALAMTLLVVACEIDLSVASILGLSSALLGVLWQAGVPFALGIALSVAAGAAAGALNGVLVTRGWGTRMADTSTTESLRTWEAMLLLLLLGSLALGRLVAPGFLGASNVGNLLSRLTEVALIALAMTLLVVAGEIDLSVASILGLSSALLGVLWQAGVPFALGIALSVAAGALNGVLVTRLGHAHG